MSILASRSRLLRTVLGGLLSFSILAAAAPAADARPRGGYASAPAYGHGPHHRRRGGGDGAAIAAIAGIAALGIGAAIASSNRRQSYEYGEEPGYGYRAGYGYNPAPRYAVQPSYAYESGYGEEPETYYVAPPRRRHQVFEGQVWDHRHHPHHGWRGRDLSRQRLMDRLSGN